jgi:hypothetical protein
MKEKGKYRVVDVFKEAMEHYGLHKQLDETKKQLRETAQMIEESLKKNKLDAEGLLLKFIDLRVLTVQITNYLDMPGKSFCEVWWGKKVNELYEKIQKEKKEKQSKKKTIK